MITRRKPLKRTPLKRSTKPIRKVARGKAKRSGVPGNAGIVRLYGKDKAALRRQCYDRDGERCVECDTWLPFNGPLQVRMHMAHILGLGAGGSDILSNVRTLCYGDHIEKEHNAGGKPCPAKAR